MKKILAALVLIAGAKVFAQAVPLTGGAFDVAPGQVQSVKLRKSYVQAIYIQAQCLGSGFARLVVRANGQTKADPTIPCTDPNYTVTVADNVSSIEFINYSDKTIRIFEVRADGRIAGGGGWSSRPSLGGHGYSQSSAADLAEQAISAVNSLKPSSNYGQLGKYLNPIRKSAAMLRVVSAAHSEYSATVRAALVDLKSKIQAAVVYLDENLETDTNFDLATDLMTVKESINAMML